ncbi:MAG: UDP-glucose--hexose-1-phosphate uridylyltransferase [Erysipelotrichaceae bacterium]|nr:UDP-glucose--hexose-1-phosphate uridylyltransferase [Erysipelotrichaceae bacterium]
MINQAISSLVQYGIDNGLIPERERVYAANLLLDLMQENAYEAKKPQNLPVQEILDVLLDEAVKKGIVQDSVTFRDLLDAKMMNCIMPRPYEVQKKFEDLYAQDPKAATDWFYKFSTDTNYIRADRIKKDQHWTGGTPYGDIEISINLSKPEKDPKAIAAAKTMAQSSYPKCQLCIENEGYAGRADHPGRANHRIINIAVNDSAWNFQYSPYVYYNEHCIVFNAEHTPMAINRAAFIKLFDFVEQFPHYFLGSNADLPIVGGSILTHDHFQGGRHDFPMAKAEIEKEITFPEYPSVSAGIVNWPMSVIRLQSENRQDLIDLSEKILDAWREYSDPEAMIIARSDGEPHNTITPIVRMRDGKFEIDLVLRNNLTTEEHPLGLYHPHAQWHHIKKENIGLIEVMGLAILPARLKNEMEELKKALLAKEDLRANPVLEKHADWADEITAAHPELNAENIDQIVQDEITNVFSHVLEDAGVYKTDKAGREAFMRFVKAAKGEEK